MKRRALSKFERIKKTSEFRLALKNGAVYGNELFKLVIARNEAGISRIGISVRKANFKLATQRNKLKRYIREIFRLNKGLFIKGYDIIAIPKASCAKAKSSGIKDGFIRAAKKAKILEL